MQFRRRMPVAVFGLAASAALVMSACGGGDSEPRPRPSSVPEGAPYVDQYSLKFSPTEVTTTTGQVVYFVNSETAIHTVTINGENESGTMKKDDVFEFTFDEPGEYKITCDYHAQMKATITVS